LNQVPHAVVDRVLKLVRMLSSPNEAGNAAAALNRTLLDNGLDIHDLAGVVDRGLRGIHIVDPEKRIFEDWSDAVDWCDAQIHRLTEKEAGLIETLSYWRGAPSDAQLRWLGDIVRKLHRMRSQRHENQS
jgi:hypothetical protein